MSTLEDKFAKMCQKSKCSEHWHLYVGVKSRLAKSYFPFTHDANPYYTDHSIEHVNRIFEIMYGFLEPHLPAAGAPKDMLLAVENLNILMCATLWHDIGNIYSDRNEHAGNIHTIFEPVRDFLYDDYCAEWIVKVAKAHYGPGAIEQYIDRRLVSMHGTVLCPEFLAGLLRISDEMEEDYRRVEKRMMKTIPTHSEAYWKFCLANESIRPSYLHRVSGSSTETSLWIDISAKLDIKEISATWKKGEDEVQGIEEYVRRIEKINAERVYCNRFLSQGQTIYFHTINGISLHLTIYDGDSAIDDVDFVFDDDNGADEFFEKTAIKKYK